MINLPGAGQAGLEALLDRMWQTVHARVQKEVENQIARLAPRPMVTLQLAMDGGLVPVPTGRKPFVAIDFPARVKKWTLIGNVPGTATVDLEWCRYTEYQDLHLEAQVIGNPVLDSLPGPGNELLLPGQAIWSSEGRLEDAWQRVDLPAGSMLRVNVLACTVSQLSVVLMLERPSL